MPEQENYNTDEIKRHMSVLMEHMDSKIEVIGEQYDTLNQKIDSMKSEISDLKMEMEIVKVDVDTVKGMAYQNRADINELKAGQKKIENQLDIVINNHEQRISKLEAEVG